MENSSWTDLTFVVDTKNAKKAEALASQCTSLGIYIEDYSDMERLLPLIGRADYIDEKLNAKDKSRAAIHIYVPENESREEVAAKMKRLLDQCKIVYSVISENLNEDDWANSWKKHHKLHRIGSSIVICPSWEEYSPEEGELLIRIDPGSSFGTGGDETTRVCLRLLETGVAAGDRVLDMGCGSGVLSIAALRLGAGSSLGVDIDKNTVESAMENARLNGVGESFQGLFGNVLASGEFKEKLGGSYDLICANIMADVHIAMKSMHFDKLKQGGKLILSGIIENRAEEVRTAFEQGGFAYSDTAEENGWLALGFVKA
ncbi:MAG: 50S ribosomal protein L11 methyltransferase [Clostridia bacterium]|nr:50S ribosomal protein L11 methyltransferase [Clostridia bacterium]